MSFAPSPDIAVLISVNDLEAVTIKARCEEAGYPVRDLGSDWGQRSTHRLKDVDVEALPRTVVLVETADPEFEERLRRSGRVVYSIDHHLYLRAGAPALDRRNPRSSLEQIVDLLELAPLNEEERRVSINDRAFWPGLLRHFGQSGEDSVAVCRSAWAVRERELEVRRGVSGRPIPGIDEVRHWLRDAVETGSARVVGTGRQAASDDRLILIHSPDAYAPVILDAVWLNHLEGRKLAETLRPLEILTIFHDDDERGRLTGVEYSGPAKRTPILDELLVRVGKPDGPSARSSYWGGSGDETAFLNARSGPEGDSTALSELADQLLDALLAGNRPLKTWRTHFLQVLDAWDQRPEIIMRRDGAELFEPVAPPPDASEDERERFEQERAYFFPYLQRFLVPRRADDPRRAKSADAYDDAVPVPEEELRLRLDDLAIRSWRLKNPDMSVTVLRQEGEVQFELCEQIASVAVHLAFGRLVVLEWAFVGAPFGVNQGPLWRRLLTEPIEPCGDSLSRRVYTLANLLDFNFAARMCRSAYRNKYDHNVVELRLGSTWTDPELRKLPTRYAFADHVDPDQTQLIGWFKTLATAVLAPLGFDVPKLKLILDERARVVVAAVGAGRAPSTVVARHRFDNALARLAGVDWYEESYFYDESFTQRELAGWLYDRFSPSLYYATSHSLAFWGEGWFAENVIVPLHIPTMYRRMFLLVLLYSATFDMLARRIGECSHRRLLTSQKYREANDRFDRDPHFCTLIDRERYERELDCVANQTRRLKDDMTAFANALWFETVSPQIQGEELFRKMTSQVPIEANYQELGREIEWSNSLEQQDAERRQTERRHRVERWVIIAATMSIVFAFFGTNAFASLKFTNWYMVVGVPLLAITLGILITVAFIAVSEGRGFWNSARHLRVLFAGQWRALKSPRSPQNIPTRPKNGAAAGTRGLTRGEKRPEDM